MHFGNFIKTALASTSKCFICGRKGNGFRGRLVKITRKSMIHAYSHHKIIIKAFSRCCKIHLSPNGEIRVEEYKKIPTVLKIYDKHTKIILESLKSVSSETIGLFDKFNNIINLEDDLCLKVTGWSKIQFISFCKYITSIYDTAGRTKYELVALYRFWVRKGIDQCAIAMYKSDSNQQQISHYLKTIRNAINKDFVKYFLGAKSKSRKFFTEQNNKTAIELFDLKNDDLCIVADATYIRCEKSASNEVQYSTWSEQKKDLLVKPMILCTPNGYIIDCYGLYKASQNDATILDHILRSDTDLLDFLLPNKTIMILDRGFRDIVIKLQSEYQIKVKIPTCTQLKKNDDKSDDEDNEQFKQLTTKQTTESRFVTKIRFIIEKVNSVLKNKRGLDHVRNTTLGHTLINYRICCAMHNFTHKAVCPDGDKGKQIAQRMKEKAGITKPNILKSFLGKQLGSGQFISTRLSEINDFVRLTSQDLIEKIFFGTFLLRQCRSYYKDLINEEKCFIPSLSCIKSFKNSKIADELENSKIISVYLPSRHFRSEYSQKEKQENRKLKRFKDYYKVFIQYDPKENNYKSIKCML